MSQLKERKREREFTLPPPICSIWALCGLDDAAHIGEDIFLLSLLIQILIFSWKQPQETYQEVMFYQLSGPPSTQLS